MEYDQNRFINASPGESMFQKTLTELYFEFSLAEFCPLPVSPRRRSHVQSCCLSLMRAVGGVGGGGNITKQNHVQG